MPHRGHLVADRDSSAHDPAPSWRLDRGAHFVHTTLSFVKCISWPSCSSTPCLSFGCFLRCFPQKPGSATLPFFGVVPAVVDEKGNELEGACEGYLCIKQVLNIAIALRTEAPPHNTCVAWRSSLSKTWTKAGVWMGCMALAPQPSLHSHQPCSSPVTAPLLPAGLAIYHPDCVR